VKFSLRRDAAAARAQAKAQELRSFLFRVFGILPARWGVRWDAAAITADAITANTIVADASPATKHSKATTTVGIVVGLTCTLVPARPAWTNTLPPCDRTV
jgi:hypothetical protein